MPRTLPPDRDIETVIHALRAKGWTAARISEVLRVSPATYKRRLRAIREQGLSDAPAARPCPAR